jgi:hypothetical protein
MACEEVGLIVHQRRTQYLRRRAGDFRILRINASPAGIPREEKPPDQCFAAIEIQAVVRVDGRWSERVGIRATTHDKHLNSEGQFIDPFCQENAVMKGRTIPTTLGMTWADNPGVALLDLTAELMKVLKERDLVRAALGRGEQGPWKFAKSRWVKGSSTH